MRRLFVIVIGVLALALAGCYVLSPLGGVFTGGAAKLVCSGVFASGRDEADVRRQELERLSTPGRYLGFADVTVDHPARTVTATVFGLWPRTAIDRTGIGCTADEGISIAGLRAQGSGIPPAPLEHPDRLWPEGDAVDTHTLPPGVDGARLTAAVDGAFAEPEPERPRQTRAVVIVYRGRIIAERYGDGFGAMLGHQQQNVVMLPSHDLVVVRTGLTEFDNWDLQDLVVGVMGAVQPQPRPL